MPEGTARQAIERRFSAAANTYDANASIQAGVAEELARLARLHSPPPARVLDIGCGTGSVLQALGPGYQRCGLDVSQAMIAQAALKHPADIQWIHSDIMRYACEEPYELIVSASTLHWLCPLTSLFPHLRSLLKPEAQLIFALMLDGTLCELNELRDAITARTSSVSLPSLSEVETALQESGFRVDTVNSTRNIQSYPTTQSFLSQLHASGVTARSQSAALTRSELHALFEAYEKSFRIDDSVYATWEVGYFSARLA